MPNEQPQKEFDKEPTPANDFRHVKALMLAINSPDGFEPTPPRSNRWHKDKEGTTPLQRMWSEMMRCTVGWGHRTPYYSIDSKGTEGHMKHLADRLDMDLPNTYRTWRAGVARGLWRNGTKEEGEERLYLRGDVPKEHAGAASKADGEARRLQYGPHIAAATADWPEERKEKLYAKLDFELDLERYSLKEIVAGHRAVHTERWDFVLQEAGIPPNRQEHARKGESDEDRARRLAMLETLRPSLTKFVHSLEKYVQSSKTTLYKVGETEANGTAKSNEKPVRTRKTEDTAKTAPTLLPLQSKYQRDSARPGQSLPNGTVKSPAVVDQKPKPKQLPAPASPLQFSEAEKQAMETVFERVESLQMKYEHLDFALERINPEQPTSQLFAYRLCSVVGCENLDQFFGHVERRMRQFDKNALGKDPSRELSRVPRKLGIILAWAVEYAAKLDEAARATTAERKRWYSACVQVCREILLSSAESEADKQGAQAWLDSPELQEKAWQSQQRAKEQRQSARV
jgi:hypothetical protein